MIKRFTEIRPKEEVPELPTGRRGLYVLYRKDGDHFDVVYIGMATRGIKGRLKSHINSPKGPLWTHFSAFEVWDNIRDEEIAELEGLFRHIYRADRRANELNVQKNFKQLNQLPKWS